MPNRARISGAWRRGALAALALLVATPAAAQPGPAGKDRAAALVMRAQRSCAEGGHDQALAALDAALELYPHARIRYRTGVEHQHLGNLVEAIEVLERYLTEADREPEYVADAVSRINQIRPGIGAIEIVADPGGTVEIDGRARGETPLGRVRLTAGRHRVLVSKPGFATFQTAIDVVGGQTLSVPVQLRAADRRAPTWGEPPRAAPPGDPEQPEIASTPSAPKEPGGNPIELGLMFSGGVWTSGTGETSTTLGAAIGGSYRLSGDRLSFHVGPRATANTINDLGRTVYATTFLVAPQARLAVVPGRFQASFELGTGLLVIWGLQPRSMLLIPQSTAVTGGLSSFAVRPVLTFEYLLGRDVALVTGMAAVWSPSPDPAFRERFLMRFDFAVGLSWSL
jgi:hypothetical protein